MIKRTLLAVIFIIGGIINLPAQHSTAEFISKIAPPNVVQNTKVPDGNRTLFLKFPYLYVANQWAGLEVIDVSDAQNPKMVGNLRSKGRAQNVTMSGDYLLMSDDLAGVLIIDVSNPASPKMVGQIKTNKDAYWVTSRESLVFIAHGKDGFSIWDLSDATNPSLISETKTLNWAWSFALKDNYLFVADNRAGMLIYDISSPATPRQIGRFKSNNLVRRVQIEDDYAFLADGPGGVEILNISNIAVPTLISHVPTNGFVYNVFKSGQNLFMADEKNGLMLVNITDLSKPVQESTYSTESGAFDVWKENIFVYLCTDRHVIILRHDNPPILAEIAPQVTDENKMLALQLKAHDPDNDPIYFKAENLPQGAAFDSTSGYFEWTPTYDQAGEYANIKFTVIENTATQLSHSRTITIHVNNVNRVPSLAAIEAQTTDENKAFTLTIPEGTDPDKEDGGKLVYRAENLPEGATFDAATRTFSWTPTYEQSGSYLIDFVVADPGELVARQTFELNVTHVDRAPTIEAIANQTIDENQLLTLVLNGSDPDKEDQTRLVYQMKNLPEGALFDPATHTFTWTPTYEQSGEFNNIIASIVSGPKSDSTVFSITVNHVNRAPVLAEIPAQVTDENTHLTFTASGSDPDKEDEGKLTYAIENAPEGATFDAASGVFSWIPTFEQSGEYTVTVSVLDPAGLKADRNVLITVNHVNRAPVLAEMSPFNVKENQLLTVLLQGSDPDKEDSGKLSYAVNGAPEGLQLNTTSGEITWTPTFEQSGSYSFAALVSDGQYADTQTVVINVEHVNRPPVLDALAAQTVDENTLLTFALTGSDPDKEDAGKLTYSAENLPEGAVFDAATGTFSWTPTYEQSGSYQPVFKLSDPAGLFSTITVDITVNHVNRPPQLQAVADVVTDENKPVSFTLLGSDPDKEDEGKLLYSGSVLPEGSSLDAATGLFTWTPTYDQSGEYVITFTVTDAGGLSAKQKSSITVNHVNRVPQLESIAPVTSDENKTVSIILKGTDPDKEDTGKLTMSVSDLPEGASFNSTDWSITWTPTYDQAGSYTIPVTLSDPAGLQATASLSITVNNVNREPSIQVPPEQTLDENAEVQFTITASDPDKEDQGQLTLSAQSLPEGATFNPTDGSFSWKPGFNQAGSYSVEFKVSDSGQLTSSGSVQITVNNVNREPVLQTIPPVQIKENQNWKFTIVASDPDEEDQGKLKFRVENTPAGFNLDASTGTVSWTPGYDQAGEYTLPVSVSDQSGATVKGELKITVSDVNRAPKLENLKNVDKTEGDNISFSVSASDPDGDNLEFSASSLPADAQFDGQTFSWNNTVGKAGSYKITITVKDGRGGVDSGDVWINIKAKPAPAPENQ